MSKNTSIDRLILNTVNWADAVAEPNALPEAGAVGSFYQRVGNGGVQPTELYLRENAGASGWIKQNLVNLDVYNIDDFGAVGDGVTDDAVAIMAAITACNAAGGGIVYIPPRSYIVGHRITALASFELINVHNILFLGDGFASKLLMSGNAGATDWYLFYMHDGTSDIMFSNFYADGAAITNPDPGEQTHLFYAGSINTDTHGGATNIDYDQMYVGSIQGDVFRYVGSQNGGPVTQSRVEDCSVLATNCRCEVAVQRYVFRVEVVDNFLTGSNDQDIDFEPTGGATPDNTAENIIITGNQIDHSSQSIVWCTLNGNGAANPSIRSIFNYNILHNGSTLEMRDTSRWVVHGNILIYTGPLGGDIGISIVDGAHDLEITANIFDRPNRVAQLYRAVFGQAGSSTREHVVVNDNIARTFGDATGGIGFGFEDNYNDSAFHGNICTHDNANAGLSTAFRYNAVTGAVDGASMIGNMAIAGNAALLAGCQVSTSGAVSMGNFIVYGNWIRNAQAAIRMIASGGGSFVDWRIVNDNNGVALTTSIVAIAGGFTNGVSIEGNAGPAARFVQVASTPSGAVPSVKGSVALNTGGGEAQVLWYKAAAASATDTAGWDSTGPGDFMFAAQSVGIGTTAVFMAPGMDLAVTVATEIQVPTPRPGTVRQMILDCVAGVGGGNNTYTARKNGSNTTLTFTVSNTAITGTVSPGTPPTTAAGDLWSVQVTKTAVPATPQTLAVVSLEITG